MQTPRTLEAACAAAGLVLLAPLLCVIAAAVKLADGGPVLYRARRTGRNGRVFVLYKFRTMIPGADQRGPAVTGRNDARVTPLGGRLRALKLDELPQLFNVVRGDMALVGPRPEDPAIVALYTPEQRALLKVRPGLTSPATLAYRDESSLLDGSSWERRYLEDILPRKLELEAAYLHRRSFLSDCGVILRTVGRVLTRT